MKKVFIIFLAFVITALCASCSIKQNSAKDIDAKDLADKIIKNFAIDDPEVLEKYEEISEATAPPSKDGAEAIAEVINPSQLITRDDAARILGVSASGGEDDIIDGKASIGQLRCVYKFEEWEMEFGITQDASIDEDKLEFGQNTYYLFNLNSKIKREDIEPPDAEGLGDEAYFSGGLVSEFGPWALNVYANGYWLRTEVKKPDGSILDKLEQEDSEWRVEKEKEIFTLALERLNNVLK